LVIVGNKADLLEKRQVEKTKGESLAQEMNCLFFETSAVTLSIHSYLQNTSWIQKTKENVEDAFLTLVQLIQKSKQKETESKENHPVKKNCCLLL
jgi:GTPase SAR1 family protein